MVRRFNFLNRRCLPEPPGAAMGSTLVLCGGILSSSSVDLGSACCSGALSACCSRSASAYCSGTSVARPAGISVICCVEIPSAHCSGTFLVDATWTSSPTLGCSPSVCATWRLFRARGRIRQNFIIVRLIEHRGPSCLIGLIIAKRDATWFEGSSSVRLPLLLGRLVCHCPLSPGFLQHQWRTLLSTSVHTTRLRRNADGTFFRSSRWSCIHCWRPIAFWHTRKVHRPILQVDLRISESVHCSAMTKDKKHQEYTTGIFT